MKLCKLCSRKAGRSARYGMCRRCFVQAVRAPQNQSATFMQTGGLGEWFENDEEMPIVGTRHRQRDFQYAMSFVEIGAKLGISWQRAKQIYDGAIEKLRAQGAWA